MFANKVYKSVLNYGYLCINDLDKEDGSFHKNIIMMVFFTMDLIKMY